MRDEREKEMEDSLKLGKILKRRILKKKLKEMSRRLEKKRKER